MNNTPVEFSGFSAIARDHAANPRNYGPLKDFQGHSRITGPCGDTMEFWLTVQNGTVDKVSYITDGCGSSLACGSIATILAQGKSIEEAATLGQQDILNALGGLPVELEHCALLAANALKAACEDYIQHQKTSNFAPHDAGAIEKTTDNMTNKENTDMKIAIPLADGKLAMHFGHCERFALVDVDPVEKRILKREDVTPPPHEPGLLPKWLAERGATVIIAGGMGSRAQGLFAEQNIQVVIGAPVDTPERLVDEYLAETLQAGENICDH